MSRKTITAKYGIEMKEPRRIPAWLKMLIIIALVVLGIYLSYHFVVWVLAPTEEDIKLMEATPTERVITPSPTEQVTPTPTPRPSPAINPDMSYDLMMASQIGEHVKGWVEIPGLGLDTVVVQWEDNEYFKEADINLNDGRVSGAVYFDYRSDFSYILDAGHIVIYGHNNLGGGQLKSMVQYVQKGKMNYYQTIVLETLYGRYNFRPFSVHIEDDDSPYVIPVNIEDKKEFINMLMEATMFVPDEFPQEDSVILTFSIDVESEKGSRLLIHAFLNDY
jgi:hypothetical protein